MTATRRGARRSSARYPLADDPTKTCKEAGHKTEDCPRDPNIRTGRDGKKEIERIKQIKACKKIINDTADQTVKLFMRAIRNTKSQSEVLAKGALMFSDYNYLPYNSKVLIEHEEESAGGKDKTENESESKSDAASGAGKQEAAAGKEAAPSVCSKLSLPKQEIDFIIDAQQKDELADLIPMKICIQSDNYGANVRLRASENADRTCSSWTTCWWPATSRSVCPSCAAGPSSPQSTAAWAAGPTQNVRPRNICLDRQSRTTRK